MVGWVSETAHATQFSLHGSFYFGCDDPHDTEIKLWICENADSESAYNKSSAFISFNFDACYMLHQFHISQSDHCSTTQWSVQIMKALIM
jgi:hypothetical protein